MQTDNDHKHTEQNVIDSDGTLIISHGTLAGVSKYAGRMADNHDRPCLYIDLNRINDFNTAQRIRRWIKRHEIEILNVAGPRAGKDPYIYQAVMKILVTVFHIDFIESTMPDTSRTVFDYPRTIDEAVDALISEMPLRQKTLIASMKDEELIYLRDTLGVYILEKFGPLDENTELLKNCCAFMEVDTLHADDASAIILTRLWRRLKETHTLRLVK